VSPIIFQVGPLALRWYGLMYVTAALVGAWLVRREAERKRLPITADEIMNFAVLCVFSGLLGGRIYYVAFHWDFYGQNPWEIPQLWHGGLAIHGGLFAGVIAGFLYIRRLRLPLWPFADAVVPAVILGQAFGRFGNFMNGDAHGVPTRLPWGVVFPPGSVAGREFPGTPTHPVMLYELALNLLWFGILMRLRLRPHKPGFLFCLYFVLYSLGRGAVEGLRADSEWIGPFRAAHVFSLMLVLIFGGIILKYRLWEAGGGKEERGKSLK